MQDQDHGRGRGDKVRWYRWAGAVSRDPGLSTAAKLLAWLLADVAQPRGCFPRQSYLAAASGLSPDTVKRAVAALRKADWLAVDPGRGRTPSRYVLVERDGATPPGQGGQERPVRGGNLAPSEGAPLPTRTTEGTREGTERENGDAPVGARSPSSSSSGDVSDAWVERALTAHANVIAGHNGVAPRSPTASDRAAAREWLARVRTNRQAVFDDAMSFALADPFWAQQVGSFAKFDRHFDVLLAAARAAEKKLRRNSPCRDCGGHPNFVGELDDDGYCDTCADQREWAQTSQ